MYKHFISRFKSSLCNTFTKIGVTNFMFQGQVYAIKYNTRTLFETIGLTLSVYDLGFYLLSQSNSYMYTTLSVNIGFWTIVITNKSISIGHMYR